MKFRPLKYFLAILFLAFVASVIVNPKAPTSHYYVSAPKTLVIAHQSGDGIWPGDTMLAFDNAVEIGLDVAEKDAIKSRAG